MCIHSVSDTAHFTSRVQVEDVNLSRKVLYYFAIDSIVNKILIFENRWMKAYPPDPPQALVPRHHDTRA